MPTITTFAKPVNDFLMLRIPEEYRSYSFQVVLIPKMEIANSQRGEPRQPTWAGLCENAINKNADGPHDMKSIRESITAAERVSEI